MDHQKSNEIDKLVDTTKDMTKQVFGGMMKVIDVGTGGFLMQNEQEELKMQQ